MTKHFNFVSVNNRKKVEITNTQKLQPKYKLYQAIKKLLKLKEIKVMTNQSFLNV